MTVSQHPDPSLASRRVGKTFSLILITVFGIPFIGFGLMALTVGARKIWRGGSDSGDAWAFLVIGSLFILIGAFFPLRQLRVMRRRERQREIAKKYEHAPWLADKQWAIGRISCSNGKSVLFAWLFALAWNAISSPMLFYLPQELRQGNRAILVGLVFPLIGAVILAGAIHSTLRWRRFGGSQFEMASVPGVIGGFLRGKIHTSITATVPEGVRLTLACINRRISGSGKHRSAHERVLWQKEVLVEPSKLHPGPSGLLIPVEFSIPFDCTPTDRSNARNSIHWRLSATANLPGVDYSSSFEVPVFKTADSSSRIAADVAAETSHDDGMPPSQSLSRGITLDRDSSGALAVTFGAARNIGAGLALTAFTAIFAGAAIVPWKLGLPFIFPLVFGFFDLVLMAALVHVWLFSSHVIVRTDEVHVWRGVLGIGRRHRIPKGEIARIRAGIGMHSGSQSSRPYYDIQIEQRSGRRLTIASSIRSKREAEYIAFEVSRELGLSVSG